APPRLGPAADPDRGTLVPEHRAGDAPSDDAGALPAAVPARVEAVDDLLDPPEGVGEDDVRRHVLPPAQRAPGRRVPGGHLLAPGAEAELLDARTGREDARQEGHGGGPGVVALRPVPDDAAPHDGEEGVVVPQRLVGQPDDVAEVGRVRLRDREEGQAPLAAASVGPAPGRRLLAQVQDDLARVSGGRRGADRGSPSVPTLVGLPGGRQPRRAAAASPARRPEIRGGGNRESENGSAGP
ncbi:hypothetical protein THAOC_26867, partial [Thalassiosira oceanica]